MTEHRYAVLDADGVKINTITADEDVVNSGWYPGYGFALVDEGENPSDPLPPPPIPKPDTWIVYPQLKEELITGERLDFNTGAVLRAEPPIELSSSVMEIAL